MNGQILQIVADVFEMNVATSSLVNTAASGAALRALDSFVCLHGSGSAQNEKEEKTRPVAERNLVVRPIQENVQVYRQLYLRFGRLESLALEHLSRNGPQ